MVNFVTSFWNIKLLFNRKKVKTKYSHCKDLYWEAICNLPAPALLQIDFIQHYTTSFTVQSAQFVLDNMFILRWKMHLFHRLPALFTYIHMQLEL